MRTVTSADISADKDVFNIFVLIKFFSEKCHRDEFISGIMYMKNAEYFRKIENEDLDRGDSLEGASMALDHRRIVRITMGGIDVPPSDLLSPIAVHLKVNTLSPIFCMYAGYLITRDGCVVENASLNENVFRVNSEVLNFGKYAAAIFDVGKFKSRVLDAIRRESLACYMGLVRYAEDDEIYSTEIFENGLNALFRKRRKFEYQSEYRIAIKYDKSLEFDGGAYRLDIGDISDLVMPMDIEKGPLEFRFS